MDKNTLFDCIDYITPKAAVVYVNCQHVLCKSGEAPDMKEGWKINF